MMAVTKSLDGARETRTIGMHSIHQNITFTSRNAFEHSADKEATHTTRLRSIPRPGSGSLRCSNAAVTPLFDITTPFERPVRSPFHSVVNVSIEGNPIAPWQTEGPSKAPLAVVNLRTTRRRATYHPSYGPQNRCPTALSVSQDSESPAEQSTSVV